jgi:hypothetical protein
MVTTATTGLVVVVFAPTEIARGRLEYVLDQTSSRLADIVGGRETERLVCA